MAESKQKQAQTPAQEEYETLLDEAYKSIKPIESKIERFEIPKVEGHIEGNKTIITNFKQIAGYVRREPEHFLKYLLRELAAAGGIRGDQLIFAKKIPSRLINEKIQQYVNDYVLCKECGKPDTELMKQDRILFIHCLACGAKKSLGAHA